jgi:alpha/beta superfamily hydrolase
MPVSAVKRTFMGRFIENLRAARRSTADSIKPPANVSASAKATTAERLPQRVSGPAQLGLACFSFLGLCARRNCPLHSPDPQNMAETFHRSFFLKGQAGRIEAMLWTTPQANPRLAAVVCHPHPLFGGTMHNKVVFQTAKALHRRGVPVLRFNFRGTGLSEGVHDRGIGEREDIRAGLDYMANEFPGVPILLAGFSFGSLVGLRVGCEDIRVTDLIGLGIPVDKSSMTFLRECTKPKLFLQGATDQFGSRENVEKLFNTLPEPKELVFVENADHFFTGHLSEVAAAIDAWLTKTHPGLFSEPASL